MKNPSPFSYSTYTSGKFSERCPFAGLNRLALNLLSIPFSESHLLTFLAVVFSNASPMAFYSDMNYKNPPMSASYIAWVIEVIFIEVEICLSW